MRYSPLLFLLPFSLSLPLLPTLAADYPGLFNQSRSSQNFWSQAEQLVQEQLYLINNIQQAIAGPDLNRVEGVQGQLFLHLGTVERFLKSQYSIPPFLCSNGSSPPVASELTLAQRQVYCALYASTQQLSPVVPLLERRLPMLAGLAAPNPPLGLPLNFRNPVTPRFSAVPNLPVPDPPVIGLPQKTAISDQEPPFQPAILPPQQALTSLSAAREQLLSALPAFPATAQIIDPAPTSVVLARGAYGLSPAEPLLYAKFLSQPNTGIARVLPAQSYRPDPNQLRNRLQPTVAEQFPFVSLGQSRSGLTPRFMLQIEEGNFQIPFPGVDYGFMLNLGEVSLENLKSTLQNVSTLSEKQREFFLNYSPPNQLEALQVERLRFLNGKEGLGYLPPPLFSPMTRYGRGAAFPSASLPVATQAAVVLNNTYLVRLFQFQLPEVILKRESISRAQRRYIDQILETPSSDLLVAFQPVRQHSDGSYTVLWRVLQQFPDPKITNLENYVDLE